MDARNTMRVQMNCVCEITYGKTRVGKWYLFNAEEALNIVCVIADNENK
jgi:hypothetical protein